MIHQNLVSRGQVIIYIPGRKPADVPQRDSQLLTPVWTVLVLGHNRNESFDKLQVNRHINLGCPNGSIKPHLLQNLFEP